MKKLFIVGLFCCCYTFLAAQCVKPTPMTTQQAQAVTGTWKMKYTCHEKQYEAEVKIQPAKDNDVTCNISQPPLTGKETAAEYFYCPGGEFHLKKYVGDVAYVFQGTPQNGRIKGILSFYDKDNKRTMGGHFTMEKVE